MELIQIGENALKVTLTREDMEYYDINFEGLDYANIETRRALHCILDEAKRTLGFSADRERLYIQAFADAHGGCELFVRRTEEKTDVFLYRFFDMETLLLACARLANCRYAGGSRAYIDDGGALYLTLSGDTPYFLSELARRLPYKEEYLREHARLLCENAVATLAPLK